jgi:hypothetical protein
MPSLEKAVGESRLSHRAPGQAYIVMSDGVRIVTNSSPQPANAFTMGGIARDAGLNVEQFEKLL